jgi:hypothetical protein
MTATVKAKGKDLEAFRMAHDKSYLIPRKIKAALEQLGDSWEYEAEFIRRAGVCQTDFAAYRDEFMEFCVPVGGKNAKRVWAGTKKFAAQLRERAG